MKFRLLVFLLLAAMVSCNNPQNNEAQENTQEEKSEALESESTMQASPSYVEKEVQYSANDVSMQGFLAYDENATEKKPGVLVVHEWWGHNEHTRNVARKLAKAGYVALAVDMYGNGKKAEHPDDAKKFSSQVMQNFDEARARFNAAKDLLQDHEKVNSDEIAAIGYCFGGGVVLNMARQGADLDAVVSIHGNLTAVEKAEEGDIKAKILVLNGEADPFSPPKQREAFEQEMQAANADYRMVNYPGAKHAFTNPKATELGNEYGLPLEYNEEADEKSWNATLAFLNSVFEGNN